MKYFCSHHKSTDFGVRHRSLAAGLVRLAGRVTWVGFLLGFFRYLLCNLEQLSDTRASENEIFPQNTCDSENDTFSQDTRGSDVTLSTSHYFSLRAAGIPRSRRCVCAPAKGVTYTRYQSMRGVPQLA